MTGQVETLSAYGLAETAASLVLLFWWYHLDKAEHDYAAGRLMNAGVLLMAVIALPIYFVRYARVAARGGDHRRGVGLPPAHLRSRRSGRVAGRPLRRVTLNPARAVAPGAAPR